MYGGGSFWSWPETCESVARGEYAKNSLLSVTLAELKADHLVK